MKIFRSSKTLCFILVTASLSASALAGDNDDPADMQNVQKEWSEAIASLKGYSVAQRDVAVEKAGETLADMDTRIDDLEQRTAEEWADLSAEARVARRKAIRELTVSRNELAEWYGGMKHSSSQAWGEVQEGFIDAYGVMQDAWNDALEEFD